MCGIVGVIGSSVNRAALTRCLPWISRRGPDSSKGWISADGRVALLHARLSIVDRDPRADQPFENKVHGVTIGFVGEIYNYSDLKKRFRDFPFKTESDTEVIVAAYTRHGVEGLRQLKGMFTIVIVDEARRRVFIARDPIGKKPLFLARWGGQTYFGSSVVPLAAAFGFPVSVDESLIDAYWQDSHVPPDRSAVIGAAPVLPGQVLELDWSGKLISTHRCDPTVQVQYEGEDLYDVRARLKQLIYDAVARRLSNNPAPVALLSGGIDSTVVSAAGMKLTRRDKGQPALRALTLGSVVPGFNDERYAFYAARRMGIDKSTVKIKYSRLGEAVRCALDLQDEPLGMPSFFVLERLVKAASEYGRILITGDGGDEVFLGYADPDKWRIVTEEGDGDTRHRDTMCVPPAPNWMSAWGRNVAGKGLVGHMLAKIDRASAEQGVEIRCPLLDWDVVCYARSLPFDLLTNGHRSKGLLKDSLDGWPRWFTERSKKGFTFNLRWLWGLTGYSDLREAVQQDAVELFGHRVPAVLRGNPLNWNTRDIFHNFTDAWRLLAWSQFSERLAIAGRASAFSHARQADFNSRHR